MLTILSVSVLEVAISGLVSSNSSVGFLTELTITNDASSLLYDWA